MWEMIPQSARDSSGIALRLQRGHRGTAFGAAKGRGAEVVAAMEAEAGLSASGAVAAEEQEQVKGEDG